MKHPKGKGKKVRRFKAWLVANKHFDFQDNWFPCFILNLYKTKEQALGEIAELNCTSKSLKVVPVIIQEQASRKSRVPR